jgi:lipopolysaccharide/colanic/teichoic acid biosynthesis glycosyltransferase
MRPASGRTRLGFHGAPAFIKAAADRMAAAAGLLVLSPALLAMGAAIVAESGRPVLFRHERVGKDGRLFTFVKFRTMRPARPGEEGVTLDEDDPRITRVGRWLRAWSLDELPQLWHILRGEMSLVGPRPAMPHQVARYTPEQRLRLAVRPGLTGWAQVNGRNMLSWPDRIRLDIWYVENASLRLDLVILWRTLRVVLRREGLFGPEGRNEDFGV